MSNRYASIVANHDQERSSMSTEDRANRYEEILKRHASSKSVSDENSGVSTNIRAGHSTTRSEDIDSVADRASKLQLDEDSSDDEASEPLMKPFVQQVSGRHTARLF
eukprot:7905901-Pyramimonas_sp.AAC.1